MRLRMLFNLGYNCNNRYGGGCVDYFSFVLISIHTVVYYCFYPVFNAIICNCFSLDHKFFLLFLFFSTIMKTRQVTPVQFVYAMKLYFCLLIQCSMVMVSVYIYIRGIKVLGFLL